MGPCCPVHSRVTTRKAGHHPAHTWEGSTQKCGDWPWGLGSELQLCPLPEAALGPCSSAGEGEH